jgi:DNA repair protein RadC
MPNAPLGRSKLSRPKYEVPLYRVELVQDKSVLARAEYMETPQQAADLFRRVVGVADREHLIAFFLTNEYRVTGVHVAAVGSVNMVNCPPSSVFKGALLGNAAAIILAHNHPSGRLEPSAADVELTHHMELSGAMLGIAVVDHVIVGRRGNTSLRQTDRMLVPDDLDGMSDEDLKTRLWTSAGFPGPLPTANEGAMEI